MSHVVVVMMGGGTLAYEQGSTFEVRDGWLVVNGTTRTPIAAYANHRVVRCYYADDRADLSQGREALSSAGL